MEMNPLPEEEVNMTTQPLCECGHEAKHHAIDHPNWDTATCLTKFYQQPTDCRCEEYRAA